MRHSDDANVQFGRRLQELRKYRGLTQVEVGRFCDLSGKQISKLERGGAAITVATLMRLAKGLGCYAAWSNAMSGSGSCPRSRRGAWRGPWRSYPCN